MDTTDWTEVEERQRDLMTWLEEQFKARVGIGDEILAEASASKVSLGEAMRRVRDRQQTKPRVSISHADVRPVGVKTDPEKGQVCVFVSSRSNDQACIVFPVKGLTQDNAWRFHDAFLERRLFISLDEVPKV